MNIPYAFKKCNKCGEWLVANTYNFRKEKRYKWGLYSQCKKCEKEYNKEYRENNKEYFKEYFKEYSKEYYENNKEHLKEYSKEYRENNKEHLKEYREYKKEYKKEYNKEYRENNKEHLKEYSKEYRENNKEHLKEYNKIYRKNNPQVDFNYNNKRRNRLENRGRGIDKIQWKKMMLYFDFKCAYSGEKMEENKTENGRTVDHIIALDNGGLNEPWNCVPMLKSYNSSKNKRVDVINWYLEQEYFNEERLNKIVEWQIYAYEKWGGEEFGELILITDLIED